MPLYKYACPVADCDRHYDDLYFSLSDWHEKGWDFCPVHGHGWFELSLSIAPAVHDWGMGRYFEHVSATGETFYSKKEFKEYCKKHQISEHCSYG